MKDASRIQAIITLLEKVLTEDKPSDAVISAYFRQNRYIGAKDRNAVAAQIYDLLRHFYRLSWWVSHLAGEHNSPASDTPAPMPEPGTRARRLVLAYLRLVKKETAADVARLFSGEKFAPAPFSVQEKKLADLLEGRTLVHPHMPDATRLECRDAIYTKLADIFGSRLEEELLAMQTEAPLDIRVNSLKATRTAVKEELHGAGIKVKETPFSPWGLRLEGRPALAQMPVFQDGRVEIQDEGSQLIPLLLAPQPGMSVVDFCAGAGGKTLALSALMENRGRLVACDVLEKRLKRAKLRFTRAGAHNIETRPLKSENDEWVKRNAGKFDRVLVDAPCSGTGTWRRNPDARWKELGPKLDELVALQGRILASAARLVKPGGQLVYATCSLLPDENHRQVEAFLAAHGDFALIPSAPLLKGLAGDMLVLTPAQHGTDGFFAALLQRKQA